MKYVKLHGQRANGRSVLVDDDDVDFELASRYRWTADKNGYAVYMKYVGFDGKNSKKQVIRLHRLIANAPDGTQVDHVNGDPLDNRRENLRLATQSQNSANMGLQKRNKTGYKGVRLTANKKKFIAQYAGKYIDSFETAQEASEAYVQHVTSLHGEFARAK